MTGTVAERLDMPRANSLRDEVAGLHASEKEELRWLRGLLMVTSIAEPSMTGWITFMPSKAVVGACRAGRCAGTDSPSERGQIRAADRSGGQA